ncbi:hypothetical protein MUP65_00510, partial [Patescibacteria group bacterium]|nr:hypothetical protein [Patescibacteria group bacterium]
MKKLLTKLREKNCFHLLAVVFLLGLVGLLVKANWVPGTWLTGWDNLHSEFNLALNFRRTLQSVWQEYQGLGLLTGMAHAADLPRFLYVWVLTRFMAPEMIRYAYHFSMLAVGSLGMYAFLASKLFPKSKINRVGRNLACLVGAVFYLLNWGTVQYFYTPFEAFSHFWAFFPWLIWAIFGVLDKKGWLRWLVFFLINFAAGSGYYVQTLFVVYVLVAGLILLVNLLEKKKLKTLIVSLGVAGLIFAANAYWLLPSGFFTLRDTGVTRESKINMMATRETFYRNQERGKVSDFLLMRGFYLDYKDWIGEETGYFMPAWRGLTEDVRVTNIGCLFVAIAVIGLWGRSRKAKYLGLLWLMAGAAMMTAVWPLDQLNQWLHQFSVLDQIFRAPFTKFIVVAIFAQAGLVALGLELGLEALKKIRSAQLVVVVGLVGMIVFSVWPAFEGDLFYFNLRVEIPEKYFELFEFMEGQDKDTRIANLPQLSFWGWTNYAWGG